MATNTDRSGQDVLLKGGLIVDGTGAKAFTGNLLLRAGKIHRISPAPIHARGTVIPCAGKVVAPGFIDSHSHMDFRISIKGHDDLKRPFLRQGITTFVAGNCGISAAGFRQGTAFKPQIENHLRGTGLPKLEWDTVGEYFSRLAETGISHNLALLVGHGSLRTSIRGLGATPLHPYESAELGRLLARAMEEGARGVSLGLQCEPGIFASYEELVETALAVKKRSGILSVHMRAMSAVSGFYPVNAFGKPHNIIALEEMLAIAKKTGVRLQISHLAFVGTRTWKTAEAAIALIDRAVAQGADVCFDIYPYLCGVSRINALMPPWFLARGPSAYDDPKAVSRLRRGLALVQRTLGFGAKDIQLIDAREPELKAHDGMFVSEISRSMHVKPEEALIEIARKSGGCAGILCHRYSTEDIVESLMRHPACLFMTDAWVEPSGPQNPSAYGAFPRFLKVAREKKNIPLEEAVRKMTGAAADRFGITDRGILAEGKAADITVFDWEKIEDNNSETEAGNAPAGIEHVFVNGRMVIGGAKNETLPDAGVPLPR
jgi:N-acyl-D-amino-acid deacylase